MSVASTCNCGTWLRKGIDCAPSEHASDCPVWGFPTTSRGERVNDTDVAARLAEALPEHQSWCHAVAHAECCDADDCDCGVTDSLHRLLPVVGEIADQRAAEEAAEAARLRETVARVERLTSSFREQDYWQFEGGEVADLLREALDPEP